MIKLEDGGEGGRDGDCCRRSCETNGGGARVTACGENHVYAVE